MYIPVGILCFIIAIVALYVAALKYDEDEVEEYFKNAIGCFWNVGLMFISAIAVGIVGYYIYLNTKSLSLGIGYFIITLWAAHIANENAFIDRHINLWPSIRSSIIVILAVIAGAIFANYKQPQFRSKDSTNTSAHSVNLTSPYNQQSDNNEAASSKSAPPNKSSVDASYQSINKEAEEFQPMPQTDVDSKSVPVPY